jgi:hypothetical protein
MLTASPRRKTRESVPTDSRSRRVSWPRGYRAASPRERFSPPFRLAMRVRGVCAARAARRAASRSDPDPLLQ